MTEEELVARNNERQKLLNKANGDYYGRILAYTRLRAFFKDGVQVEQMLLDILEDLLDAQRDGVSAADYYGTEPAAVTRDMLRAMPNSGKSLAKLIGGAIGVYVVAMLLPALLLPNTKIDVGILVLTGVCSGLILLAWLYLFSRVVYTKHPIISGGLMGGLLAVALFSQVAVNVFLHTPLQVSLAGAPGIVSSLLFMIVGSYLYYRSKARGITFMFIFLDIVIGLLAIGVRVSPKLHHVSLAGNVPLMAWLMVVEIVLLWLYPLCYMLLQLLRAKRAQA